MENDLKVVKLVNDENNFCSNCGTPLNDGANFCTNCGSNCTSNKSTEAKSSTKIETSATNDVTPVIKEKKKLTWIFWVIGGFLILGSIMLYGYVTYPKTEIELNSLLCDKYWKVTSSEIDEIYINDVLIPKSGGSIQSNIKAALDNRSQIYETFQEKLDKYKEYDDFFTIYYNEQKKGYCHFELSYDNDDSEYKYSTENPKLNFELGKYIYEFIGDAPDEYSVNTDESVFTIQKDFTRKKYTMEIESISNSNLSVLVDFTVIDNETKDKLRVVLRQEYSITNPDAKYLAKVNAIKLE